MDLPPPPPLRHQLRYGNFLPPPDSDRASPHMHRLPPPQRRPPHSSFPPPPLIPALHGAQQPPCPHSNVLQTQHHVIDRIHFHESEHPRLGPYFYREHLPRSPPLLPPRESIQSPLLHEFCRPSPFLRFETLRQGCEDRDRYELPPYFDRHPLWGSRELQQGVTDDRQNYCDRSRFDGVYDRGCLLYKDRDYVERRMEGGMIERGNEMYNDGHWSWSDARRACDIKARGHELSIQRYYHENGWKNGTHVYSELGEYGCKNEALWQSRNPPEEVVEGDSSWDGLRLRLGMREDKGMFMRFNEKTRLMNKLPWQRRRMGEDKGLSSRSNKKKISRNKLARQSLGKRKDTGLFIRSKKNMKSVDNNSGQRIGMMEDKELFIGSRKRAKLLNKDALDRIELGKNCTRDSGDSQVQRLSEGLSGFSVRIEEKEGSERMEAGNKDNREKEQSLVDPAVSPAYTLVSRKSFPSHKKLECSLNLMDESNRIVCNISGSPLAGSSKDVTQPNPKHGLVLQSDLQGTYSELLGKYASSESADATDLGENAMKNALNFLVPNLLSPCGVSRLRKKRKVGNQLLPERNMLTGKDCRISANSDDQSAVWTPNSRLSSLEITNSSPFNVDDAIADSSYHTERLLMTSEDGGYACQFITDEVECFPHGKLSAMQSTRCRDSSSFNQESTKAYSCMHNLASSSGAENSSVEPICHGRVNDINEDHFQKRIMLPENYFVNGPLKTIFFLEDHDVTGLPGCEKYNISVLRSEINQLSSSSEDGEALLQKPENALITHLGPSDADFAEFLRNQVVAPQIDVEDFRSSGGDDVTSCSNYILGTPGTANFLLADCVLPADRKDVHGSDFSGKLVASGLHNRSCIYSPEYHSDLRLSTNVEDQACNSENEMICDREILCNGKSMPIDSNTISLGKSPDNVASDNLQVNAKISPSPCEDGEKVKKVNERVTLSKKTTWAVPKVFPSHYSLKYSNASKSKLTHAAKPMVWHRNVNSSAAVQPSTLPTAPRMNTARATQNKYIRKGNALVRKPSNYSVTPPAFHGSGSSVYNLTSCNTTNIQASSVKNGAADASTLLTVVPVIDSEMPKALPLSHSGESVNFSTSDNKEPSLTVNSPGDGIPCKTVDAMEESTKNTMFPKCQADSLDNSDSQHTLDEGHSGKKIMYIKRKSYQLLATSNSSNKSMSGLDHDQPSLSDGYYKSKKNQLIRAASENHFKKGDTTAILNRVLAGPSLTRRSNKRQSGLSKPDRYSRLSFVWRLRDKNSSGKHKSLTTPQKVLPQILTWKRSMYWRSCKDASGLMEIKNAVPTTSQKFLLSRKRGAIYTSSSHGYSLKMSKVLSIGGSSLKWSKSMERNSKKVNEQVACAIAAAVKPKKDGEAAVSTSLMSRNPVSRKSVLNVELPPGERIFCVGSERYKMDPTKRTLQRIIAEEVPSTSVLKSEKNVKVPFVPRRLLIGSEEYVRIGNGNQLVRNPKKRTRVLATEKVRWSLRTARLRLARKSKYCQFFTRFGKCNKDDGKCPYIHDPSKIVVCTKFLSGSCSDPLCKLTHQVIPERMQDCSYFLKGSCSNDSCPYRHVNVNPDSTVCQSFLRGYCAEGNESIVHTRTLPPTDLSSRECGICPNLQCQKKHTYVCPAFEETGICPQESTCKLHHPKKKTEKIPANEPNIVRGRYFDGGLVNVADYLSTASEKLLSKGKDDLVFHQGKLPDYISLDVSDDEGDLNAAFEQGCDDVMPVDNMPDW